MSPVQKVNSIIADYHQLLIAHRIHPQQLYLFGAYALGAANESSDINLAIISDDFSGDPVDDFLDLMRLRKQVDLRIEPHPFRPEDFQPDNPKVARILETGIKIVLEN